MKNRIMALLGLCTILYSCSADGYADYDPGRTRMQPMSGEWYIVTYGPDGEPAFEGDYVLWTTYNTAADNDEMWVADKRKVQLFKSKVDADLSDFTFSGPEGAPNLAGDAAVTVKNGKIIKNGGKAFSSKTVVDSIYFEVEFAEEPGIIYSFSGHERTGFLEDDDPTIH